jgi:CBS domain-containing protein
MMRVSEMMSVHLVTCSPSDTVADACRRMCHANVGSVLACEGTELQGILTERDVLRLVADGRPPEKEVVADHMSRTIFGVAPDAPASEVAELMNERRIRHMPVLDGGTPVGIVSLRDFFVMSGAVLRAQGADAAGEFLRAATPR